MGALLALLPLVATVQMAIVPNVVKAAVAEPETQAELAMRAETAASPAAVALEVEAVLQPVVQAVMVPLAA